MRIADADKQRAMFSLKQSPEYDMLGEIIVGMLADDQHELTIAGGEEKLREYQIKVRAFQQMVDTVNELAEKHAKREGEI